MSDYKDESLWLMKGDCLERMKEIPDKVIGGNSINKRTKNKYLKKSDYEFDDGYIMADSNVGDTVISIAILLLISFLVFSRA